MTPAGPRQLAPFYLGEHGLEGDGDRRVGISIWGRYKPIWADWRHQFGGSGQDIALSADLFEMADAARAALATVVPEVTTAPLTVVECFY